jgi:PKD repeat protein
VPLTVAFSAATSSDPDNTTASLTYAWDLDGDGQFNDSTAVSPSFTYTTAGTYRAAVRVTDPGGASATDAVTVTAGNTPPTAVIASPSPGVSWKVGDVIAFKGSAVDEQDGALPPSALSWSLIMHHCPSNCHTHPLQTWDGTDAGSFATPDHEYPSYLELRLTATDAGGLTDTQSMRLDPRTVALTLASSPSGLTLALGPTSRTTPFTTTVIEGSLNSITAPSPQTLGGTSYSFRSWSDGGAAAHSTTASADKTLTATYGSP